MVSGGESSVPRVPANVGVLRRALLVCAVLVIGPTVAGVWAARTLTAEDSRQESADLLKPTARGEFGPFLAVAPGEVNDPESAERCDVRTFRGPGTDESLPLADILSSPLAIPEISASTGAACNGVVISVSGAWTVRTTPGNDQVVSVSVFLTGHLPQRVEWWASGDLTELGQIGGYPALIEQPIPGQSENFRLAYVLFAEPTDDSPGVIVRVQTPPLERAAETAISSLEERIAEMGLPPKPAGTFTTENPPKWMTDQQALMETIKHDNALIDQDLLKPQARGDFGPFLLVGPGDVNAPPSRERCDVQTSYGIGRGGLSLAEVFSSPLALPELSNDNPSPMASACDGVVTSINGGWLTPNEHGGDEAVDVGIYLIGYLPFRLEWQEAAERTELGEIDGYPALIEHAIPGLIMDSPSEAYIVFSEPGDDKPGIIVKVGAPSAEKAAEAVISSLEKRIAEMGLPPNPYN